MNELDQLLIEAANITRHPFIILDADMSVRYANPAFLSVFQITLPQIQGHSFFMMGSGQWNTPGLKNLFSEILPEKKEIISYRIEQTFETIGKKSMLLNAHYLDGKGRFPDKILAAIEDVTEREQLHNELIARCEFSEKLIDSLREAVLVLTPDLKVHKVNDAFYNLFQVTPELTIGAHLYELGNGQWDIPDLRQLLGEILPQQNAFDDYELEHEFEGIGWRHMSLNARKLDHLPLILLTIRDLTPTMLSHRKLQEAEKQLQHLNALLKQQVDERTEQLTRERNFINTILDNQPTPILVTDADGRVIRFNQACENATGYAFEAMRGTTAWMDLIPVEERKGVEQVMAALKSTNKPIRHENHWRHRDGSMLLFIWHNVALKDASGRIQYYIGSGVDITEQRKVEAQMRQHLEEAARLQRMQTANELATLLAHELNQPLGALSMFADVGQKLLEDWPPDRQNLARNLLNIHEQTERVSEIIYRLRRFVNQNRIDPAPLNLNAVVESGCSLCAAKAKKNGILINLQLDATLPPILGVRIHLEQVLLNLLNNAIEAIVETSDQAGGGDITIQTRRKEDLAIVTVRDSGPGIDAMASNKIFEGLYTTKTQGLGVGLRISRSLIEAHRGRLWAEPHTPGGVFHFQIPIAP